MLKISDLLKNIVAGQSGIPTRLIFAQLDNVYMRLKSGIKILKAELINGGIQVYLIVPSQSDNKKYYDVDFWFDTNRKISNGTKFKVFSNSPNFGYSYAYLFHKQKSLLFPEKYPRIMLSQPPKVRNPYKVVGFDKHVFSGLKYLSKENLLAMVQMSKNKPEVDITDFEDKMKEVKK